MAHLNKECIERRILARLEQSMVPLSADELRILLEQELFRMISDKQVKGALNNLVHKTGAVARRRYNGATHFVARPESERRRPGRRNAVTARAEKIVTTQCA